MIVIYLSYSFFSFLSHFCYSFFGRANRCIQKIFHWRGWSHDRWWTSRRSQRCQRWGHQIKNFWPNDSNWRWSNAIAAATAHYAILTLLQDSQRSLCLIHHSENAIQHLSKCNSHVGQGKKERQCKPWCRSFLKYFRSTKATVSG